jgi:hypothetical protein
METPDAGLAASSAAPALSNPTEIELKQWVGHLFWASLVLACTVGVPALGIIHHPIPHERALFFGSYIVIFAAWGIALLLWCHCRGDLCVKREENTVKPLPVRFWRDPILSGDARLLRAFATLFRLELFGWIVWLTTTFTALSIALDRTAGVPHGPHHLELVDAASADLARGTVIGVIVLFFGQLLGKYKEAIEKADHAANNARTASSEAEKTAAAVKESLPRMQDQADRLLLIMQNVESVVRSSHLQLQLVTFLQGLTKGADRAVLKHAAELSEALTTHLEAIHEQVTSTDPAADPFDFVTLTAVLKTYLDFESLMFPDGGPGRRGCTLSTHFASYALAVRAVVTALEEIERNRFRYYTILNRTLEGFFNVENHRVDPRWSIVYLEEFCRGHHKSSLPFQRIFLTSEDDSHSTDSAYRLAPFYKFKQQEHLKVLCDRSGRPMLWVPSHRESASQLARQAGLEIASQIPLQEQEQLLSKLAATNGWADPCYALGKFSEDTDRAVIAELGDQIQQRLLVEVMRDYHSPSSLPLYFKFADQTAYDSFFGKYVPRDLFAVFDSKAPKDKEWRLCMGTMAGHGDPIAVTLLFVTPDRPLRQLPWDVLFDKLNRLFVRNTNQTEPIYT